MERTDVSDASCELMSCHKLEELVEIMPDRADIYHTAGQINVCPTVKIPTALPCPVLHLHNK